MLDGLGLASEDRLVDSEPHGLVEHAVRDELIARLDAQAVAGRDLVDRDGAHSGPVHDLRVRSDERGQAIERALRPNLLGRADAGIADENTDEQRVLPLAEGERHPPGDGEDEIEDGEDIGADDARVRATGARSHGQPRWQAAMTRNPNGGPVSPRRSVWRARPSPRRPEPGSARPGAHSRVGAG